VQSAAKGEPKVDAKALAYQQAALQAINEADSKEHAQKRLDMVRLRVKEKAVPAEVFHRVEAEFKKVWEVQA
jgi:hypothetical protein